MRNYDILIFAIAVVGAIVAYSAGFVSGKLKEDESEANKLKITLKFVGLGILTVAVVLIMIEQLL